MKEVIIKNERQVTLSIESGIYEKFKKHCESNAIVLSKKIELFIDHFLKETMGKKIIASFMLIFLLFSLNAVFVSGAEILENINNSKDAFIWQNNAAKNYGASTYIGIDNENGKSEKILLEFNLSHILSNSIVKSAILELYQIEDSGATFNILAYRINQSWNEGTSTGATNSATYNGTTWNERYYLTNWGTAGGSYDTVVYANVSVNSTINAWKQWNITSLVQGWVNGTWTNYGLILATVGSIGGNNEKQFASAEFNTNLGARLIINYSTAPEIAIVSPLNFSYNTKQLLVNISSNGVNVWFYNGTANETYTTEVYRTFSEGSNTIIAYANDSAGNLNQTSVTFSIDTTPPAKVANLANKSSGYTWIYWNWTNPADPDFNSSLVYFMEIQFNTTDNYYNATGLEQDTNYTLTILTKDNLGNINTTNVSSTAKTLTSADTTPPASITGLTSPSKDDTWIYWTWDNPSDADFFGNRIYINGILTAFISNNSYNLTNLVANITYNLTIHTLDSNGNLNDSEVSNIQTTLVYYCGDGRCARGENCASCSTDCGACPSSGGSSGGSPSGGGIYVPPKPVIKCIENWTCGEWTECSQEEVQIRACSDLNDCNTTSLKPLEIQHCEKPTCSDGIQNQEELGIDCGGPCAKRCMINEITGNVINVPSAESESSGSKQKYGFLTITLLSIFVGFLLMINKIEFKLHHKVAIDEKEQNKIKLELKITHISHIIILVAIVLLIYYFLIQQ